MRLTTITVSYGQTQSLPEYSNVKPSMTLSAELGEGDDPEAIKAALLAEARAFVQAAIDDALEINEQPARYSAEPRFRILVSRSPRYFAKDEGKAPPARIVVIVPAEAKYGQFDLMDPLYKQRHRYRYARQWAEGYAATEAALLIDCADGDLSRIPDEHRKVEEAAAPEF